MSSRMEKDVLEGSGEAGTGGPWLQVRLYLRTGPDASPSPRPCVLSVWGGSQAKPLTCLRSCWSPLLALPPAGPSPAGEQGGAALGGWASRRWAEASACGHDALAGRGGACGPSGTPFLPPLGGRSTDLGGPCSPGHRATGTAGGYRGPRSFCPAPVLVARGSQLGPHGQPAGVLSHREGRPPLLCTGHQSVSGYSRQCTDLNLGREKAKSRLRADTSPGTQSPHLLTV